MNSKLKSIIVTTLCAVTLGFGLSGSVYAEQTTAATEPSVSYNTHVQNIGWQEYVQMNEFSGSEGKGYRLEGIHIKLDAGSYDLGIEYQTHIQNIGWEAEEGLGLKTSGQFSGTEGKSWRLEGIKIRLTGADADKFDILYKTHIQNVGWEKEWKKNGEMSGTKGQSLRLEGIYIQIVKKSVTPPVDPTDPVTGDGTVTDPGDLSWDKDGDDILDDNEKDDWRAIPPQNPNPIIVEPEYGHFTENPDYVPWVVNLPQTAHAHKWVWHKSVAKLNGVQAYRMSPINLFNAAEKDPEKRYMNDVANGCQYNFVEWCYGHGNSYYPNGIEKSGKFGPMTVEELIDCTSIFINEEALGHPQSQFTNEEYEWAEAHTYTDFAICAICGETKTTWN